MDKSSGSKGSAELKPSSVNAWEQKQQQQHHHNHPPASGVTVNVGNQSPLAEVYSSVNDNTGMVSNTPRPKLIDELLHNNKRWSARIHEKVPDFFSTLAKQQTPEILWIGCSDSRVPANQIIDLPPGEVFVHRNIANVFTHTDLNALSVLQFAVEVLKVKHVIVCGHYGCGGVAASMENKQFGLIDNWLRNIKDVFHANQDVLKQCAEKHSDEHERSQALKDKMTELNVARSVRNVCATTVLQNAWMKGQDVQVHGWVYRLSNGLINDLNITVKDLKSLDKIYQMNEK
ncbi:hypothetical protein MP228_008068 [Amoeboaphelidium protococcarum]|nr:hypothetical protein MP228_008068 [Amoeboaphelidium protococcarum]